MTLLLFVALAHAFVPPAPGPSSIACHESLAEGLFKQAFGGLANFGGNGKQVTSSSDVAAGRQAAQRLRKDIADIDVRAQTGAVSFDDFLQVGKTFKRYNGKVPGMPGALTRQQIDETLAKFEKHEKIVLAMTPEERADPQLVIDDLDNTDEKCPRIQRLARVSTVPERDVALFCAEFEAMRQSTQRIAAGEDPDAVNADIGSSSRAARRAAKKAQKGKKRKNSSY